MPISRQAPTPKARSPKPDFFFSRVLIALTCLSAAMVAAQARPQRIISLIPAVTEILFAIGAGPQVVAVSSFDEYPPQVKHLQRVGALLDPDLERIISLKPDLVVIYGSQQNLHEQLTRSRIASYSYRHAGLADVSRTIQEVGARVGRPAEADAVVKKIAAQLAAIRERVASGSRPRTLLIFGREAGTLRGIYASGGVGFLHDMLVTAGGDNVFADVKRESMQATSELILTRKPDVILEVRSNDPGGTAADTTIWRTLASVPAVRNGRIHVIVDQRILVPGPRVGEGTELLARALHAEAFR